MPMMMIGDWRQRIAVVPLLVAGALSQAQTEKIAPDAVIYFVAPDGRDSNPGTKEQPFATLERAKRAVRQSNLDHDAIVEIPSGLDTWKLDTMIESCDCPVSEGVDSETGAFNGV